MAERVEQGGGLREGLGEGMREMREGFSREKVESRMDDVMSERPVTKHLLDMHIVARAVLIAAVLTLIVAVLISVKLAAVVLLVSFGASWFILANRQYNRRKPTRPPADSDDE